MHRSSLCEAVLGWKPLAPPLFPVVTFHQTLSAFSEALRSRNPQNTPFYLTSSMVDSSNTPGWQNLGSPTGILGSPLPQLVSQPGSCAGRVSQTSVRRHKTELLQHSEHILETELKVIKVRSRESNRKSIRTSEHFRTAFRTTFVFKIKRSSGV